MRDDPTFSSRRRPSGFTIVEIVMAFIIIGILIAVLIPTLSNRGEEARRTAALQDLERLADAQERAAIDTGYFYRIYALNDVRGGDGIANAFVAGFTPTLAQQDRIQGIRDNIVAANNLYRNPTFIFILPGTQDFAPNQSALFDRLLIVGETSFNWNGPYVNWFRDANRNDWPEDPWGNDYLFFTVRGVLWPPNPQSTDPRLNTDTTFQFQPVGPPTLVNNASGGGTVEVSFPAAQIFDRPTFLSLGPNGLPGDGTNSPENGYGKGDDIVRSFGGAAQ